MQINKLTDEHDANLIKNEEVIVNIINEKNKLLINIDNKNKEIILLNNELSLTYKNQKEKQLLFEEHANN